MIRRPPRSTQSRSSAASDVYKRQLKYSAMLNQIGVQYMRRLLLIAVLLMLFSSAAVNAHQIFVRPISGFANLGDTAILPVAAGHNTSAAEMPEGCLLYTSPSPRDS